MISFPPLLTFCLQGIKFYDPTIADDSPEAVELKGMRYLLAAAAPHLGLEEGLTILNVGKVEVWGEGEREVWVEGERGRGRGRRLACKEKR